MVDIFYSREACNTYILYNDKNEALLVDPGYNINDCLIEHINKIGVNITSILITHGHYDHISALEEICALFPDAKVYICEKEKEFLTNEKLNLSGRKGSWLEKKLDFSPKNLIALFDYEIFVASGFIIQIINTPFHTIGSSCFYVESEKVLFTGDTLFYTTIGRSDLPTGSNKTIEDSLKKLVKLPNDLKVYPGHGVITNLDREKKYNQYLRNI